MRFSTKVFIAIFLSGLIGALSVTFALSQMSLRDSEAAFNSKYRSLTQTLGDTLFELEGKTDALMRSSLRALDGELTRGRLLTREELSQLANEAGVTQLYIADTTGRFVRSTLENPGVLPNIFSFCPTYQSTFQNRQPFAPTGIMPGIPSGLPYKFLLGATRDNRHVLEVGVHADYIGRALQATAKSDPNIEAITLMAPNGQSLARYSSSGVNTTSGGNEHSEVTFKQSVAARNPVCCSCKKRGLTSGDYSYTLDVRVNKAPLNQARSNIQVTASVAAFLIGALCLILAKLFSAKLVERINRMDNFVTDVARMKTTDARLSIGGNDEIGRLAQHLDQMMNVLAERERETQSFAKNEATIKVATQLAHDIRSPLTALSVLSSKFETLPEDSRILIRLAISRIQDIANQLLSTSTKLSKNIEVADDAMETLEPHLLSSIVESLVSEKRIQHSHRSGIQIESSMSSLSYGLFAYVDRSTFSRIISNLVDNACEAIKDQGTVCVQLDEHDSQIRLRIIDNGPGIPAEMLPKIGERGLSGKADGHGLGLHHAKSTIERWGGELSISSSVGSGVEISIFFEKAPTPRWFLPELVLEQNSTIVILDDDPSIHATWDELLSAAKTQGIRIVHFSNTGSAGAWISQVRRTEHVRYLVDFEFLQENTTGLDFINSHGIQDHAILVTSHHEDAKVIDRCTALGVSLVPKSLVVWLPISTQLSQVAKDMANDLPGFRDRSQFPNEVIP